jgi:hypothetical protein
MTGNDVTEQIVVARGESLQHDGGDHWNHTLPAAVTIFV